MVTPAFHSFMQSEDETLKTESCCSPCSSYAGRFFQWIRSFCYCSRPTREANSIASDVLFNSPTATSVPLRAPLINKSDLHQHDPLITINLLDSSQVTIHISNATLKVVPPLVVPQPVPVVQSVPVAQQPEPVAPQAEKTRARKIYDLLHHSYPTKVLAVASAVMLVTSFYFGDISLVLAGSLLFGYFGQAAADRIELPVAATRFKENISLETQMGLGYIITLPFGLQTALAGNFFLMGMFIRDKIRDKTEPLEVESFHGAASLSETTHETFLKKYGRRIVIGSSGVVLLIVGVPGVVANSERLLAWRPICAEYGVKILSGLAGYSFTNHAGKKGRAVNAHGGWKTSSEILTALPFQQLGIAGSIFLHAKAPTSATALVSNIPIGIILGANRYSEEDNIAEVEKLYQKMENNTEFCPGWSRTARISYLAAHAIASVGFAFLFVFPFASDSLPNLTSGIQYFALSCIVNYYLSWTLKKINTKQLHPVVAKPIEGVRFIYYSYPLLSSEELNWWVTTIVKSPIIKTLNPAQLEIARKMLNVFQGYVYGGTYRRPMNEIREHELINPDRTFKELIKRIQRSLHRPELFIIGVFDMFYDIERYKFKK